MPRMAFEDFSPGAVDLAGAVTPSRDDIVAYARQFDPQPFHLDEEAAKQTFAGGLIASGWHSCALQMRLITDGFLLESSSMGAPGIEEVRWLKPVRPGDTLRTRRTVLETKASGSRPDRGFVRFRFETFNQRDEAVLAQVNWIMFERRQPAAAAPQPDRRSRAPGSDGAASTASSPASRSKEHSGVGQPAVPFFDDLALGETQDLGRHTFTAEDITAFAHVFDPQPFHVDAEAAKRSHFGGLCASGWHTAAMWMRRMVDHRQGAREAALARGERPAELGVSPGFSGLLWLKPVYAGDTIAYASTLVDKRASSSRPGWGLAFHRNTGHNQHGESVFEFTGAVFWERR